MLAKTIDDYCNQPPEAFKKWLAKQRKLEQDLEEKRQKRMKVMKVEKKHKKYIVCVVLSKMICVEAADKKEALEIVREDEWEGVGELEIVGLDVCGEIKTKIEHDDFETKYPGATIRKKK